MTMLKFEAFRGGLWVPQVIFPFGLNFIGDMFDDRGYTNDMLNICMDSLGAVSCS